jgi:hypothetical protein
VFVHEQRLAYRPGCLRRQPHTSRVAGRVEKLGDGVVLRGVGHAGGGERAGMAVRARAAEPASGELLSSELNPYVEGGLRELAVGLDGCAEVGVERVQEPLISTSQDHRLGCFPDDSSSQVSVVCVCVRYVKLLYGFDVTYVRRGRRIRRPLLVSHGYDLAG